MQESRRDFVRTLAGAGAIAATVPLRSPRWKASPLDRMMTIPVALVQFNTVPEQIGRNLQEIERLSAQAVDRGARWVMFHENSLCDYTPRVKELSESVPNGSSVRRVEQLARRLRCFISFGLSEVDRDRYYITQVFVGPTGFIYRYRKTWLWRQTDDRRYRNEWVRYDPGTGPELFLIDGVKATCFICADGDSDRCVERAAALRPNVVFFPNNRESFPPGEWYFGGRAKTIGAPMLVTNRVGASWGADCTGGCGVYSADGKALAEANRDFEEEILLHSLVLSPVRAGS